MYTKSRLQHCQFFCIVLLVLVIYLIVYLFLYIFSTSFQYVFPFFWLFEYGQSQKKFTQCEEEKKILLAKVNNEASSHFIFVYLI